MNSYLEVLIEKFGVGKEGSGRGFGCTVSLSVCGWRQPTKEQGPVPFLLFPALENSHEICIEGSRPAR